MIIAELALDSLASKQEDNKLVDSTQAVLAEVDVVKAESDGLIRVMDLASVIVSIMAFLPA
ncbi:MAG: hypothetical protein U9N50_02200 [Pseudomonadota bacterium]|nr:hypothetical protein [Pseudomonadota bacterium]